MIEYLLSVTFAVLVSNGVLPWEAAAAIELPLALVAIMEWLSA